MPAQDSVGVASTVPSIAETHSQQTHCHVRIVRCSAGRGDRATIDRRAVAISTLRSGSNASAYDWRYRHQGIPNAALRFIEAKLSEALSSHHENLTGVSSLAAGADQMFAEAVLRHGSRLHVIVPCRRYEASFNENASLADYRRFVQRADRVETLNYPAPSETAFLAAGKRVWITARYSLPFGMANAAGVKGAPRRSWSMRVCAPSRRGH